MSNLLHDIRYAFRLLAKTPANTLLVLSLLAVGIGANTSVFSLVNALYYKALPVRDANRVVRIYAKRFSYGAGLSQPEYLSLRDLTKTMTGVAAETQVAQLHVVADGEAREVEGFFVTANYASLLGLRIPAGRFFNAQEDSVPDRNPVVVISHRLWMSQFSGSPNAMGREMQVNRIPVRIIGVMPAGFGSDVAGESGDVWLPTMMMRSMGYTCNGSFTCSIFDRLIGRLAEGKSVADAQAEAAARIVWSASDAVNEKRPRRIYVTPATGIEPGSADQFRSQMRLLMATAGLLLLIACANLAGLFLARGVGRRKEVAVRLAIGASRGRIVRQLLTESMLFAMMGGVLGLAVSAWGRSFLASYYAVDSEGFFHAYDLSLDWRILTYSIALVFASGVLFGIGGALQASRHDLVTALKEGTRAEGRRSGWLREMLVCGQVALSLVLLVSAGLLVRSGRSLTQGTNFDPRHVAVMRVRPELLHFTASQNETYYRQIIERLQAAPGVESATMIQGGTGLIWKWDSGRNIAIRLPGQTPSASSTDSAVLHHNVGAHFFETLKIPILQGRAIDDRDNASSPRVAVVNQTLAARYWPNASAVGETVLINEQPVQVVGVAADIQPQSQVEAAVPYIYRPYWQSDATKEGDLRLAIRVKVDPAAELPNLRRAVRAVNPQVPLGEDMPMTEQVELTYMPVLLARSIMTYCGALALCLSALGLYSVLAFSIRSRTREIGIRMALGAHPRQVVGMLLCEGLRLGVLGLCIGIAAAIASARLLQSWLFGVKSLDLVSFAAANVLLIAVALLASYWPATSAARIDPILALRTE